MKNTIAFLTFFLFMCFSGFAQVSISTGNSTPDQSAMLDVQSSLRGVLLPRVSLTAANIAAPIVSPAVGLIIYNTAAAGTTPNNVHAGYYQWDGTKWVAVSPPNGVNIGDMLYWSGTQWLTVPVGTNGQVLTLNNGIPVWVPSSSAVPQLPALVTNAASGISAVSAISGGIVSDGGAPVTARGMCWSSSHNPTTADFKTTDGAGAGSFSSNLTGLTVNRSYFARAWATNSVGTSYGNEIGFTTLNGVIGLTTHVVASIKAISAVSGGTITNDEGLGIIAKGVCWSTSPNPTIADSKTTDGTGSGTFSSILTGLTVSTLYHVRAYATNSVGTSYGNEVSFTTQTGAISLTTNAITNITGTRAVSGGYISGDGGDSVLARGVCWGITANPTIANNITINNSDTGTFTSDLTGMALNTTYFVRAYATNNVGTCYGNELSFKTALFPSVGDYYQGGIVFYVDGTGHHGLIAATTDQAGGPWGCSGTSIPGTSTAIGTGQANTTAIVNLCSSPNIAARQCDLLEMNGYSDWFLPSLDELNQMFLNSDLTGPFGNDYYWCSSEASTTNAWIMHSIFRIPYSVSKSTMCYVRAARAF